MDKTQKQSFDKMEGSSHDTYVYTASDNEKLKSLAKIQPTFHIEDGTNDFGLKMAAIQMSYSVVSLVSFSNDVILSSGSGTIIETEENTNFVLTSLNLIRLTMKACIVESSIAENLKIIVRCSDKNSYLGEVYCYDYHYNLLIITFKSRSLLQSATVGRIHEDPRLHRSFELQPHMLRVRPGDRVAVAGRYFYRPFHFMCATGSFSMGPCEARYGCRELLSTGCNIMKCGDGGPLINSSRQLIGIVFYEGGTSPFLPISIACKWWNHYKQYKEMRHPSYGFEANNMFLAIVPLLESFVTSFPDVTNGVMVEKVVPKSHADASGLREKDVIFKCDGIMVNGFLELWDLLWPKVGGVVELEVARVDISSIMTISMMVGLM